VAAESSAERVVRKQWGWKKQATQMEIPLQAYQNVAAALQLEQPALDRTAESNPARSE